MAVGLSSASTRARPAPARPGPAGPWRGGPAVVVLLVLAAVGAGAWLLFGNLTAAPAATAAETRFAVRAYAIDRFGYGAARLAWYDGGLAALQVAGYETVTGALRRGAGALGSARGATALASVLAALALTVAARRLKLSGPALVAVPVLFGLVPAAVLLHRSADPTQLAVLWACVALALAAGEARRIGAAIACVAYLVAAAVTSPLVLVALVPLFAMLFGDGALGRLGRRARLAVRGLGLLLGAGLVALAALDRLPGGGAAAVPSPTALDVLVGLAVVAAGIAGLTVRWVRPLAVALLTTLLAAAAAPDVRGSLLLVALPLAAVVLPAVAEVGVAAVTARMFRRPARQVRLVPVAVVGVLAVVFALAWLPAAGDVRGTVDEPGRRAVDDARAWVLTNLPSRPALVVDDVLWASLTTAGYPAEQLLPVSGIGPARPGDPPAARYVVGRDATLLDAAADARRTSAPVAEFGTGGDLVAVRRVAADPDSAAAGRETAGRIAAGGALAGNPRLDLTPTAAALLRRGQVDPRALAVLAAITGDQSLAIADFPVVPGEDPGAPRRLIAVSAVGGTPVTPGAGVVTLLDQWLRAQQPPYRPAGTELARHADRDVLLVRYDALGSTGLLPP